MDCDRPPLSGYIDFEIERKCGRLSGTTSKLYFNDKVVGEIDENNLVHWNSSVTLDDLKSAIQSQLDFTRWQVNQYKDE
jgi:hypothetical protein